MTTASITAPAIGAIAPETPFPRGIDRLTLLLIKPSKYDDDGYVMRFVRGVLPSNTLATLAGLTDEVAARGARVASPRALSSDRSKA